jgi:hypothetical protein
MMRPLPRILSLAVGTALCVAPAAAQNVSLNAVATVSTVVTVSKLADLSFDATAVVPGMLATVAPANGGRVRIDYNEPTTVTIPNFVLIPGPGGAALRVDLVCAQHASATAAAPTLFVAPCAGGFVPPLGANVGGTHYVYIGGTITPAATTLVPAGAYAGNATVTATYVVY